MKLETMKLETMKLETMKPETTSRSMSKSELAQEICSDAIDTKVAVKRMMSWINRCTPLMEELRKTGYNNYAKVFTPKQVELICEYLVV